MPQLHLQYVLNLSIYNKKKPRILQKKKNLLNRAQVETILELVSRTCDGVMSHALDYISYID